MNELRGTVESDLFKKMLPPLEERVFQTKTMKIHWAKVSLNTLKYLEAQGLLSYDNSSMHPVSHDKWVFFEEKTGLLYMSILAKHISRQETEWTTPSTDESMYEALSFQAKSPSSGSPAVALHFFNALPIPRKDISFEQILKFKRKRQQELSSFREQLNSFEEKLRACQSDEEMSRVSTIFSQQIKREVNELSKAMSSDKLSLVSSSLKSIIELTQPALLTAAAGQLIQANPLEWMGGGFVVSASVRILSYIVDKRNARQAMFDKAPVAYLYYADKNKVF